MRIRSVVPKLLAVGMLSSLFAAAPAAAAVTKVELRVDKPSPRQVGTVIGFEAVATGSGALEYQFFVSKGAGAFVPVTGAYVPGNTMTWTPSAADSYRIRVNVRTQSVGGPVEKSVTLWGYWVVSAAPVTSVKLTANKLSPQPANTTIRFTAEALSGDGPYEYRFWVAKGAGAFEPVTPGYVAASFMDWVPTQADTYKVKVDVRNQLSIAPLEKSATRYGYVIVPPPVASVELRVYKSSPQQVGTTIAFEAVATGGIELYEYHFWVAKGAGAFVPVTENYVPGNTMDWVPTEPDTYKIKVDVRNQGSSAPFEKSATRSNYRIISADAVKSVSLSADKSSPQPLATAGTIRFTAAGTPGTIGASVEYKFWLFTSAAGKYLPITPDYTAANFWDWTPDTPGIFKVMVYARIVGSELVYERLKELAYTITAPPTLGEVTPAALTSLAGSARTLSAVYSDVNGFAQIKSAGLLVNGTAGEAGGISLGYDRSLGRLFLANDAGTASVGDCAPGSPDTLTNSQGTLNCADTVVTCSGNDLTIAWSITPKAAFSSPTAKNVYTCVTDNADAQVGWEDKGDWRIMGTNCLGCHDAANRFDPGNGDPMAPGIAMALWTSSGHGRTSMQTVSCTDCHNIDLPAGQSTHFDGVYNSVWENGPVVTRNTNTAHLRAEFFSPVTSVGSGDWDIQVTFDNFCFNATGNTVCHNVGATPRIKNMRHEQDTCPNAENPACGATTDTNHWSVQHGTHKSYVADRSDAPFPTDKDLNINADSANGYAPCISCHDPHGTAIVEPDSPAKNHMLRRLWVTIDPTDPTLFLCYGCHPK